jgi:branched-chain amino acid transport system substrate-binding protein
MGAGPRRVRTARRLALAGLLVVCLASGGCAPNWLGLRNATPVVKIGLVAPFEGRYRSLGYEALYAAKWVVRQRNDAGGVAGYRVELVALDDGDDPSSSAFQARKFAVDHDVMGVIGPFSSATVAAAAPAYREVGLAMITPATCPSPSALTGYTEVFCLGASGELLAQTLLDHLSSGAAVALIRSQVGALGEALSPRVGKVLQVQGSGSASATALAEVRATPADVYLYDGDALSAAELVTGMRQAGMAASLWGGPDLVRSQVPQIAADAVAQVCYAQTAPLLADLAAGSALDVGYRELAGSAPGSWAALTYDATTLLLDALQQEIAHADHPTRRGLIDQLNAVRGPEGSPVFEQGVRRAAQTLFRCYGQSMTNP